MKPASDTGQSGPGPDAQKPSAQAPAPADLLTHEAFRRYMAERFAPGSVRAEMDKLKKVLDRAIEQREINPVTAGRFKFGDLVGVVARSRSHMAQVAAKIPHTQFVSGGGGSDLADTGRHVLLHAPKTLEAALQQIAELTAEKQAMEAAHRAEIIDLQRKLQALETQRERGREFGRKGGRPRG